MPPTKKPITVKQDGAALQIFRGDEQIASQDIVSEEVTFTEDKFKRHKNAVDKALKEYHDGDIESEEPPPVENTSPPAATEGDGGSSDEETTKVLEARLEMVEAENTELRGQVKDLVEENSILKNKAVHDNQLGEQGPVGKHPETSVVSKSRDPRYADEIDDSKAPAQDPLKGDLTPAYINWARENMPPEVFKRRYNRRIPEFQ
jgi:hypothetical protein